MLKKMSKTSIMNFFQKNRNTIEVIYNLRAFIEDINWTGI